MCERRTAELSAGFHRAETELVRFVISAVFGKAEFGKTRRRQRATTTTTTTTERRGGNIAAWAPHSRRRRGDDDDDDKWLKLVCAKSTQAGAI